MAYVLLVINEKKFCLDYTSILVHTLECVYLRHEFGVAAGRAPTRTRVCVCAHTGVHVRLLSCTKQDVLNILGNSIYCGSMLHVDLSQTPWSVCVILLSVFSMLV